MDEIKIKNIGNIKNIKNKKLLIKNKKRKGPE